MSLRLASDGLLALVLYAPKENPPIGLHEQQQRREVKGKQKPSLQSQKRQVCLSFNCFTEFTRNREGGKKGNL
jgi:hypothetical protein